MSETLGQELERLLREYHEAPGDDPTKEEAWNLIADYVIDNGEIIVAALSAGEQ